MSFDLNNNDHVLNLIKAGLNYDDATKIYESIDSHKIPEEEIRSNALQGVLESQNSFHLSKKDAQLPNTI